MRIRTRLALIEHDALRLRAERRLAGHIIGFPGSFIG
jgi:hypothetical protein